MGCVQDTDVLDEHYKKNWRPWPPNASDLAAVRGRNNTQDNADNDESDSSVRLCNKRYSKTPKNAHSASPTQIGFYPPKWKDFLEECKVETRAYAAISDPWPHRRQLLNGFILDTINMTILKWKREEQLVEKGYYPKYKKAMGELVRIANIHALITHYFQLFDDLASWRGKIKKAASNAVRAHYDLFPPKDSNFSKAQTCNHVKLATSELIKKSAFAHGSKDEEVRTHSPPRFISSISLEGSHRQFRSSSHPRTTSHLFVWPQQSDQEPSTRRIWTPNSEWDFIPCHHCGKSQIQVHSLLMCPFSRSDASLTVTRCMVSRNFLPSLDQVITQNGTNFSN